MRLDKCLNFITEIKSSHLHCIELYIGDLSDDKTHICTYSKGVLSPLACFLLSSSNHQIGQFNSSSRILVGSNGHVNGHFAWVEVYFYSYQRLEFFCFILGYTNISEPSNSPLTPKLWSKLGLSSSSINFVLK